MLKSFFHFRSGARCDEGLPEENGLPASEPAEGAEKVQEGKVDARGGDPVVPESVEEEIDESALVDGMPGRGGERNRLVELQNLGFGQRSFTVVTLNYCSC